MPSNAYHRWTNDRLGTVQALRDAHRAVGGDDPGRRWTTAELNRLMTVAAVGEFSAFIRELFIESVQILASTPQPLAPPTERLVAALAGSTARALTNPSPEKIARLFRGLGMTKTHAFWKMPDMASHGKDKTALNELVDLRNSLAHGGTDKVTLRDVKRQVRLLKRIARSTDRTLRMFLTAITGAEPWDDNYGALGAPFT